jgi:asparagine synthase (glutamine-hydrolysing)
VIIPLFIRYGVEAPKHLDGEFVFVLFDSETGAYFAARDPIGVAPMYIGYTPDGAVLFSSEMKSLSDVCSTFEVFPPGCYLDSRAGPQFTRYYTPRWLMHRDVIPRTKLDLRDLRTVFEAAVVKRLMSDVPYGVLLSGGLDSSLVASIASRHMRDNNKGTSQWFRHLPSFCIGLPGSPDLAAAQKVADFLGTVHHPFTFTVQEGIDALRDVIYHVETYDVTTIRASTPMYLLSRRIKAMGVKMVLSGEGADEVFGGYLYFHKAPNAEEFHRETVRKVDALHLYDCNRANKSTMAWGLEVRPPFLDKDFLDFAMTIDPESKMIRDGRIEKWCLRSAFDDKENPYLPREVLWRQKEQFSDGVGYNWIDSLKEYASTQVTDQQMALREKRFIHNPPATKEAYFYRSIFEELFGQSQSAAETVPGGPSVACSTPAAIAWDESFKNRADPSGRAVGGVHVQAYSAADPK